MSVVTEIGAVPAYLVEHLLEFVAFGKGMQLGAAFWRQAGVSSFWPD